MNDERDIPWLRISAEAAAIVVSILLAFAIDAWWTNRQIIAEEYDTLTQLRSEYVRNVELLAEKRASHAATEQSMLALLRTISIAQQSGLDRESVFPDLDKTIIRWTFDPETGAISGVLESGKLSIIQSDQLRSALAGWPAKLQDVIEDEIAVWNFTGRDFVPYLYDKASFRAMYNSIVPSRSLGEGPYKSDLEEIFSDPVFENLVVRKLALTRDVLDGYDSLSAYADHTISLIDATLERFQ